jgi:hypothetical protein
MRARAQLVNAPYRDVRQELLELGMDDVTATMAVPYIWFLPGTSDPYSPVVIMVVEAIQHKLQTLGVATRADGFVDGATNAALASIAGPDWKAKPWITVIGDVLAASRKASPMSLGSLGDYDVVGYYGSLGVVDTDKWTHARDGSCMGLSPVVVGLFKEVQAQANRVLKQRGQKLLAVDGFLGARTVAVVADVIGGPSAAFNTCDELARQADVIAAQIKDIANKAGAPAQVSAPLSKRRTTFRTDPATGQPRAVEQPTAAGMLPFELTPMTLGIVAIGGVLLFGATRKRRAARRARRRR